MLHSIYEWIIFNQLTLSSFQAIFGSLITMISRINKIMPLPGLFVYKYVSVWDENDRDKGKGKVW